jgi:hypothetical protein
VAGRVGIARPTADNGSTALQWPRVSPFAILVFPGHHVRQSSRTTSRDRPQENHARVSADDRMTINDSYSTKRRVP